MTNNTHFDPSIYPLTLYYDGACPLCAAEMHNLMLRSPAALLRFVDISAEGFVCPPTLTTEALNAALHAQTASGVWLQGVPVFEAAYRVAGLPQVARVLGHTWVRPVLQGLYPFIARNRHRVPQRVSQWLFGTALRRAAQAAAAQRCNEASCPVPRHAPPEQDAATPTAAMPPAAR